MNKEHYRREVAELTALLTRCGVSKNEIIRLLDVSPESFENWLKYHKELRQALAEPSLEVQAEAALLKRALGFQLHEATAEELVDKKSGEILEILKRRTITKDVPPDVRALLFYLQNRFPGRWDGNAHNEYHFQVEADETDL